MEDVAESLVAFERVIGGVGIEEYWRKLLKRSGRPLDNEFAKLRASQIFDSPARAILSPARQSLTRQFC